MANCEWHEFASSEALARNLSETVAKKLALAVKERGHASIAVSGGRTPAQFFDQLSRCDIPWDKVTVTLVDERFVPADSPRSNARLVARHLLQNKAARAAFVGLYQPADEMEEAASQSAKAIAALPRPLDVVVLGMGNDRHTASFFPDAPTIEALLEPTEGPDVLPVASKAAGEPRLTLSMNRLAGARFLAVHIEGADKKETLEAALSVPPGPASPIGAVLAETKEPAHIFWAPAGQA
ncbi:6-phosphogluconolactonase [Nitratireductor aquimarinus]|uniref:6-phosphogluconolactonase n=1 Tax=Nitratireductor TaxID=245876 RepID=UPI001A8ED231|nr:MULTISPECIES: 6-phosphogluconolactonase [Nitratireductor]MBN8242411.1 6-phosphogluconolactonase [Nitratireductor aquimarinus]MBY6130798.1 6-phosphogluconolactonase [Nitratireductor aquimarinus]MCA1302446.1 6-phosphogluconolactonase [Nitratireductor aquimarinus]MDJ1463459.1 6-phosphogluconolactonase [Nitratireductor sp. GZWM139]